MQRSRSKTPDSARRAAERRGHRAERLAEIYLLAKFYRIRDRRFKTPVGEIDLVVEKAGAIVFVEVKARMRGTEEAAAMAGVNRSRITRAAQYWLARNPSLSNRDMRFDVIFLAPGRWPRHLINAFSAA
ncbi:YraN family protein [Devosia sp.]|uniref:YraN family protein n=1 Tax=Devosia sp. TaxID=1871048 RepID=UPI002622F8E3|nr:YraN family protein [Devosia sp.]